MVKLLLVSIAAVSSLQPVLLSPHHVAVAGRPRAQSQMLAAVAPAEVLYDGMCMVCRTNKAVLSFVERLRFGEGSRLRFVDVRSAGYTPEQHGGISFEDAMKHFHVLETDGSGMIHERAEAVLQAYTKVGLGWVMAALRLPLLRWLIERTYDFVSKHRYNISKMLPGGKALAAAVDGLADMQKGAMGEGCDDEEECMLPDLDDED
jgi:predicted DCC family thiol-disulfide oxidoreductase YuxK